MQRRGSRGAPASALKTAPPTPSSAVHGAARLFRRQDAGAHVSRGRGASADAAAAPPLTCERASSGGSTSASNASASAASAPAGSGLGSLRACVRSALRGRCRRWCRHEVCCGMLLRRTAGQGERRGSTGRVDLMQGPGAQRCVIPARQVLSTITQRCALTAMTTEERQEAWQRGYKKRRNKCNNSSRVPSLQPVARPLRSACADQLMACSVTFQILLTCVGARGPVKLHRVSADPLCLSWIGQQAQ